MPDYARDPNDLTNPYRPPFDSEPIVFRSFTMLITNLETIELATGAPLVQLCDRKIPALGQE